MTHRIFPLLLEGVQDFARVIEDHARVSFDVHRVNGPDITGRKPVHLVWPQLRVEWILLEQVPSPADLGHLADCPPALRQGQCVISPWEIWTYDFPTEGIHPCVIFNNAARLANPAFDRVNVILFRTLRGPLQRELRVAEVLLDRADGLDWETLCRVDSLHFVLKSGLRERRGAVGKERRRFICQRMLQLFPFEL